MDASYLLAVIYLYFPVILGLLSNHAKRHGHSHISPIRYAFILPKTLGRDERTIYLLAAVFVNFLPLALYSIFINNNNQFITSTAAGLLLFACIISAISFFTSPAVKTIYKEHTALLNLTILIAAAVNYSRATSYAEGVIVELTGVRASELPTAMSWLSIIMVPLAWLTMLAFGFLALYALAFLGAGIKSSDKRALCSPLNQVYVRPRSAQEHTRLYAFAFCCGVLALTPITLASLLLKTDWAEIKIREQLVSASFHVKSKACNLDKIEGAKVSPLEAGRAIIAIPDRRLGYKFELIQCNRDWKIPKDLLKTYNTETTKK